MLLQSFDRTFFDNSDTLQDGFTEIMGYNEPGKSENTCDVMWTDSRQICERGVESPLTSIQWLQPECKYHTYISWHLNLVISVAGKPRLPNCDPFTLRSKSNLQWWHSTKLGFPPFSPPFVLHRTWPKMDGVTAPISQIMWRCTYTPQIQMNLCPLCQHFRRLLGYHWSWVNLLVMWVNAAASTFKTRWTDDWRRHKRFGSNSNPSAADVSTFMQKTISWLEKQPWLVYVNPLLIWKVDWTNFRRYAWFGAVRDSTYLYGVAETNRLMDPTGQLTNLWVECPIICKRSVTDTK